MRMVCDTNYILNPDQRACPKLAELEKILEECRDNPDVKAIVFSEWERMLELARGLCDRLKLGFAWHTGTVPQKRRRAEILRGMQEVMGPLPGREKRCALDLRVEAETDCGSYKLGAEPRLTKGGPGNVPLQGDLSLSLDPSASHIR